MVAMDDAPYQGTTVGVSVAFLTTEADPCSHTGTDANSIHRLLISAWTTHLEQPVALEVERPRQRQAAVVGVLGAQGGGGRHGHQLLHERPQHVPALGGGGEQSTSNARWR